MKWMSGLLLGLAAGTVVGCSKANVSSSHIKEETASELVLRDSAALPECGINGIEYEQIEDRRTITDMSCAGSLPGVHKTWEHVCYGNGAPGACAALGAAIGRTAVMTDAGQQPGWPGWEHTQPTCDRIDGAADTSYSRMVGNPTVGGGRFSGSMQWVKCEYPDVPATCEVHVGYHNGAERLVESGGSTNKSCQIYKTKDELQTFVAGRYDSLKTSAEAAVLLEANYYVSFRKTSELSCLFASLSSQTEIQAKVATLYKNFFGADPSPTEACSEFKTLALQDSCDAGVDSLKCKTIKSIGDNRGEFEKVKTQFSTISDNVNGIVTAYVAGSQANGRASYTADQVAELARVKSLLQSFGIKN